MDKINLGILIFALIIVIISLVITYQTNQRVKRMKKRYDALLRGNGELNLEELLLAHGKSLEELYHKNREIHGKLNTLNKKASNALSKIAIIRYNAFPSSAGEKSFSLCMLDSYHNGIILTTLYGRDYSVSYGKEIESGNAVSDLSPEEQNVLQRALHG